MILIRFLVRQSPWQAGELASFPPADAQRYIDKGAAELVKEPHKAVAMASDAAPESAALQKPAKRPYRRRRPK